MKKFFLLSILALTVRTGFGAVPDFNDFESTQFATNGNKISIKAGAVLTNVTTTTITNLFESTQFTRVNGTNISLKDGLQLTNAQFFGTNIMSGPNAGVLQVDSGSPAFTITSDPIRVPTAPVALFRPITTNSAMILDLQPNGLGTPTNQFGTGIGWIDIVNRDLVLVPNKADWNVARMAIDASTVFMGTHCSGTNPPLGLKLVGGTIDFRTEVTGGTATFRGSIPADGSFEWSAGREFRILAGGSHFYYNAFVNNSNYERRKVAWNANVLEEGTEALGSGVSRPWSFQMDNITRFQLTTNGHLIWPTDNTYDIGASAATRPRNLYVGGLGTFGSTLTSSDNIIAAASKGFYVSGRAAIKSPSDGIIRFSNNGDTGLDRIQFGGTSATFPALKRNGSGLDLVGADGTYNSTNSLIVPGIVTATNGFSGMRSNLLAPSSLTFPATTVNWTNPLPVSIQVYIDNSAVTGTAVTKNGTTVFTGLTAAITLGLQVGEYFSETYSVGTPTATYSPFP